MQPKFRMRDSSGNPLVFFFKKLKIRTNSRPAFSAGHALLNYFISIYSNTYSPHYPNQDIMPQQSKRDQ